MVGGKLVAMSVDVYISMEFGTEGDLFNLRRECCQRLRDEYRTELPSCLAATCHASFHVLEQRVRALTQQQYGPCAGLCSFARARHPDLHASSQLPHR